MFPAISHRCPYPRSHVSSILPRTKCLFGKLTTCVPAALRERDIRTPLGGTDVRDQRCLANLTVWRFSMPLILWLLGVPLSLIVVAALFGAF